MNVTEYIAFIAVLLIGIYFFKKARALGKKQKAFFEKKALYKLTLQLGDIHLPQYSICWTRYCWLACVGGVRQ